MLPVADRRAGARATRGGCTPDATRATLGRRPAACTGSPPSPGWPRRGCSATWSRTSSDGRPRSTVDRVAAGHRRLRGRSRRCWSALAVLASARLGEKVLAELREDFVDRVLALPLSTVERAGTGDLLTRTSRDVDALSAAVRHAVPETLIALVTVVLTVGALLLVGPLLALPCAGRACRCCGSAPAGTCKPGPRRLPARERRLRRHHRRPGRDRRGRPHRRGAAACSGGGIERTDADIARARARAERYTLRLRTVWFPLGGARLRDPGRGDAARRRPVLHPRAGSRWARSPRPRCTSQQLIDPLDRLLMLARRAAGRRRLAGPAARRRRRARRPEPRRRPARPASELRGRRTCATPTARAATCCTAST